MRCRLLWLLHGQPTVLLLWVVYSWVLLSGGVHESSASPLPSWVRVPTWSCQRHRVPLWTRQVLSAKQRSLHQRQRGVLRKWLSLRVQHWSGALCRWIFLPRRVCDQHIDAVPPWVLLPPWSRRSHDMPSGQVEPSWELHVLSVQCGVLRSGRRRHHRHVWRPLSSRISVSTGHERHSPVWPFVRAWHVLERWCLAVHAVPRGPLRPCRRLHQRQLQWCMRCRTLQCCRGDQLLRLCGRPRVPWKRWSGNSATVPSWVYVQARPGHPVPPWCRV